MESQGIIEERMTMLLTRTALILFASGFCALLYQAFWFRAFRLIFGSSTPSNAAVLAIFMAGLGTGSLVLGKKIEKWSNPLRIYSRLEWGITVGAALSPFLLDGVRWLYWSAGGTSALGTWGATFLRLLLSACVIFPAAFLMGGTLPALSRAVSSGQDVGRRALALLYGANTLGAVVGVLIPTFFIFPILGFRNTLFVACLLNAIVALVAGSWARAEKENQADKESDATPAPGEEPALPSQLSRPLILLSAGGTGFVFFLGELVWYRMASPILGGSTYTFAVILGCALFGVGLGSLIYAFQENTQPKVRWFALTCVLQAFFLMVPFAMGDDLAAFAAHLRNFGAASFGKLAIGWFLVTMILVFPAAVVSGYQFPLLVALRGRGATTVSSQLGEIYAANTLGAIAGSLAGGFGLMPVLGALGAWKLSSLVLLVMALCILTICFRQNLLYGCGVVVVGVLTLLMMRMDGPTGAWRHVPIGAGRVQMGAQSANAVQSWRHQILMNVVEEHEGRESALGFVVSNDGLAPRMNGKSDGSVIGDVRTGIGAGLLPAFFHPAPKQAFVVGLGTGETAGWLGRLGTMERVDVAEIEPAMLQFAEYCAPANKDCLKNPKVQVHLADGRESLATIDEQYDVIVSVPSNPYRAGVASFYAEEFFQLAGAHLADGGLFAQWVQSYEITPEAFQTVLTTLRHVFAHVTIWELESGDVLLLASHHSQAFDVASLRERFDASPFQEGFARVLGVAGIEGVLSLQMANHEFVNALVSDNEDEINRDDLPLLEYMFAQSVGVVSTRSLISQVRQEAAAMGARFSKHTGGDSSTASRIEKAQERLYTKEAMRIPDRLRPQHPGPEFLLWQSYAQGQVRQAAQFVRSLPWPEDHDYFAHLVWLELYFLSGALDEETKIVLNEKMKWLETKGFAGDIAWLRVLGALSEPESQELEVRILEAIEWARQDPWIHSPLLSRGLQRLTGIQSPTLAAKVLDALLESPFSVYHRETDRRIAAWLVSEKGEGGKPLKRCTDVFALTEPHPIWEQSYLDSRYACYTAWSPHLAERALEDALLFRVRTGETLDTLMESTVAQ